MAPPAAGVAAAAAVPLHPSPRTRSPARTRARSRSTERGAPMSNWRVAALAAAMCGIQLCYAAQINLGTPQLLLLGVSERIVSLAWLAGPLSGLIMQPLVGNASDACTSPLGRRRPFLIIGAVCTACALLLFANAEPLARALVSPERVRSAALGMALCAFFLLDFSIQAVQAPLRALVTDVVPRLQRPRANAFMAFFVGLGNLIGGLMAASPLKEHLPFFATDVQAFFALAALAVILSVSTTVISTSENPITTQPLPPPLANPFLPVNGIAELSAPTLRRRAWSALSGLPRPFWSVFAVQLCTWSGFFTLFVYANAWVGRNVFLGDGTAPADTKERRIFDRGVRLGGRANALTAVVTIVYSLALPRLQDEFGVLAIYVFSQTVEAICLMAAPFIRGTDGQTEPSSWLRAATMLDIGMFGVVWATTISVPWTMIGNALDSDPRYSRRVGLFTTLFNVSLSFPQLVVAFVAPIILSVAKDDPAAIMFCGGVSAAIGAFLAVYLRIDKHEHT